MTEIVIFARETRIEFFRKMKTEITHETYGEINTSENRRNEFEFIY